MTWFTDDDLRAAAGETSYRRGREYRDAVAGVEPTATGVHATVHGTDRYDVWLGRDETGLTGECACPFGAAGNFCKHCVAVGLVLLASADPVDSVAAPADVDLGGYLRSLDVDTLAGLLLDQAGRDPSLYRRLMLRATCVPAGTPQVAVLRRRLDDTLLVRGHLDYQATIEYASTATDVLATIGDLIDSGHAAEARPLSRHAVERLTAALSRVDDSAGRVATLCVRALDQYARACRVARPNPVKLADWLVRLQLDGPGWPEVDLSDFADALGTAGWAAYRDRIDTAWRELSGPRRAGTEGRRLHELRVKLAAARGDVDAQVDLLAEDLSSPRAYLEIATTLRAAGRNAEAVAWAERGIKEVDKEVDAGSRRDLEEFLAGTYLALDRADEAVRLRMSRLWAEPTRHRYAALKQTASALDPPRWAQVRQDAIAVLRAAADRHGSGDGVVGALLDDDELDLAWQAWRRFGCADHVWLELAGKYQRDHPDEVLPGYRDLVLAQVARTGRTAYRDAARLLDQMWTLARRCDRLDEFREFVATVRSAHKRKPALLDELNRAGLP